MNGRLHFLLATLAFAPMALAATIVTSFSPAGPVTVGATFTVTLSMTSYTGADEIDGFNLKVTYPTSLFSFVGASGSAHDASSFGVTENWLRLAPQDSVGAGAILTDSTTTPPTSPAGTVLVSVVDLRGGSTRGTTASAGFLYSFDLMATAPGTGSITPEAFGDGTTLFDVALSPVGPTSFTGAPMTVVPEPSLMGMLAAGGILLALRRSHPRRR